MVVASAPGKCILFGEHAVVYGQPAVAIAIDQRVQIEIQPTGKPGDVWKLDGMKFMPEKHPHLEGLRARIWHLSEETPSLSIKINISILSNSINFNYLWN